MDLLREERGGRTAVDAGIRALATEAELRALRAQINPHFLFNALTTVGYLIQSAPPKALQTLMRLTTLLRSVLRPEGEFTTLGREREIVDCYLQIEGARFEERLTATIDIPQGLWDVPIPSVIVQPLVENAIRHGLAARVDAGRIDIEARTAGDMLVIAVTDDGAENGETVTGPERVGLGNTRARLEALYGPACRLELTRVEGRGARVTVHIPRPSWTTSPPDGSSHANGSEGE